MSRISRGDLISVVVGIAGGVVLIPVASTVLSASGAQQSDVVTQKRAVLNSYTVELSSGSSGYVLVEAGNYFCRPCRATQRSVASWLSHRTIKHGFRFGSVFSQSDTDSLAAASLLWSSEEGPSRVKIHEELMASLSKPSTSSALVPKAPLASIKLLEAGITATPTFFVITPKGNVVRFQNFDGALRFADTETKNPASWKL